MSGEPWPVEPGRLSTAQDLEASGIGIEAGTIARRPDPRPVARAG